MESQETVGAAFANEDKIIYKDSTYELVSKAAYLIGVPQHIFENEHEAPQMEVYNRLETDKAARIVRNLCLIRTAIERNFRHINEAMRMDYRTILSMPEYVPDKSMRQLSADGINAASDSKIRLNRLDSPLLDKREDVIIVRFLPIETNQPEWLFFLLQFNHFVNDVSLHE